jgi:hypothetical protein
MSGTRNSKLSFEFRVPDQICSQRKKLTSGFKKSKNRRPFEGSLLA